MSVNLVTNPSIDLSDQSMIYLFAYSSKYYEESSEEEEEEDQKDADDAVVICVEDLQKDQKTTEFLTEGLRKRIK